MLTKAEKTAIMQKYATKEGDTGSPEVQIAVLTADINKLNDKLVVDEYCSLYEFWDNKIYQELIKDDKEILDLGAKQYTRIIKKYLTDDIKYVKCYFMEKRSNGYQEIGVYVKKARGQMTRYLIENKVNCFDQVKNFNELGYVFNEQMSNQQNYVFVR